MKGRKLTCSERKEKLEKCAVERRKLFGDFCAHVRRGYSIDCFGPLSIGSIREYMKKYPLEFIQEELENAEREGKEMWESLGVKQSNGSCLGNSRSWFYNMAHRYKWSDRVDIQAEHKGNVNVNVVSYASTKAREDSVDALTT